MKRIVILGSTGSIGRQALDVIRSFPEEFHLVGLAGGSNISLLADQVAEFSPQFVAYKSLQVGNNLSILDGYRRVSMDEMVSNPDVDIVIVATTGAVGLGPTLSALRLGKTVALANKEIIVMAGRLLIQDQPGWGSIIPIDSEPSAIWQCMRGENRELARVIITASGGALRSVPFSELGYVTPEEALKHPTWEMGKKITIDSATLMNKAFEVMEVRWLFDIPLDKIDVVVHPQSIVHSLVEFQDGSVKAQLSKPDMRLPIQYALFYPRHVPNDHLKRLNLVEVSALTFEHLDIERYPCFSLGLEVARAGGTYPAALSAADEVAVELFLQGRIGFMDIGPLIQKVLSKHDSGQATSLQDIQEADVWARESALKFAEV